MLDNKPNDADHLYYRTGFYSSELIGIPVTDAFTKAAKDKQMQELQDSIKVNKQGKESKTWKEFNAELDVLLSNIGVTPPKKEQVD